MRRSAKDTYYRLRARVIIAFQILDSQTFSFHRAPLVYLLRADFSTLADVL